VTYATLIPNHHREGRRWPTIAPATTPNTNTALPIITHAPGVMSSSQPDSIGVGVLAGMSVGNGLGGTVGDAIVGVAAIGAGVSVGVAVPVGEGVVVATGCAVGLEISGALPAADMKPAIAVADTVGVACTVGINSVIVAAGDIAGATFGAITAPVRYAAASSRVKLR
jgi:hypothetical protein